MVKPLHNLGILWSPLLQDPAWLPDGQGLHRVPDTNGCCFFFTRYFFLLYKAFLIMVCFMSKYLVRVTRRSLVNFWQLSSTCWRHFSTASLTRSMPILLSRFSLCRESIELPTAPNQVRLKYFYILKKVSITCTLCKLAGAFPSVKKM